MKRIIKVTFIAFIILFCCTAVMAQEKPLIIKGLYIGMPVKDAHAIIKQLLPKEDWKVSEIGKAAAILEYARIGESKIFGTINRSNFREGGVVGDRGFAIITRYDGYEGFISSDQNNNVDRISFSKEITNILFSSSEINAEEFATSFWKNYNMPEFSWIPYGWRHTSPLGYTVTIMIDKYIDVKAETSIKPIQALKFE